MGACRSTGTEVKNAGGYNSFRHISAPQAKADFIASRNPNDFLPHNAPDSIEISGVPFARIGMSDMLDNDGFRMYTTHYQAQIQATDGTYPLFDVVVKDVRKRGKQSYQFDDSWRGTGMK